MSYVDPNYKSKKEFKAAVGAGKLHYTYNPSGMFEPPQHGSDVVEGPHYPRPHRWYCEVVVRDGVVVEAEKVILGSQPADATTTAPKVRQAVDDAIERFERYLDAGRSDAARK